MGGQIGIGLFRSIKLSLSTFGLCMLFLILNRCSLYNSSNGPFMYLPQSSNLYRYKEPTKNCSLTQYLH